MMLKDYRPLPSVEFRRAWPYWEDSDGDWIQFSDDGLRLDYLVLGGIKMDAWPADRWFYLDSISFGVHFAPIAGTWAEVEALANSLSAPGAER